MTPLLWRRLTWIVAGFCILAALWWIFSHIPRTLAIFTIAAFIAFGVQPIALRLERRMAKPLAIALVFAALLLVLAVTLVLIVPLAIDQMQLLVNNLPAYAGEGQHWLTGAADSLNRRFPQLHVSREGFNIAALGENRITAIVGTLLGSLGAIAFSTATGFFIAFSAIVLSFFFLLNDSQLVDWFAGMFPPNKRDTARNLAAEVTQVFGSYISGQVIVSAITGVVISIATAALGFKFSLILGLISAVAYAIPVIGMLIAQFVAIPLCLPQGLWMVIWVQVIIFGMARISDNVLVPKIMGESVGVSPIVAMFAVFAGGELFGIPGLILGIPVAALAKILWRYFVTPWLHARFDKAA